MLFGETLIAPALISFTPFMMLLPYSGPLLTRCRMSSGNMFLDFTSPRKISFGVFGVAAVFSINTFFLPYKTFPTCGVYQPPTPAALLVQHLYSFAPALFHGSEPDLERRRELAGLLGQLPREQCETLRPLVGGELLCDGVHILLD